MKYIIDTKKRPIYLQLYQQIRNDIIAENYPYNSKLPSKRNLSQDTGVSTITVEHAYALLCDEGYVEARQRSGFIVIFRKADGFASATDAPQVSPVYHTPQEYPEFPLSILNKTMRKVLTEHGDLLLEKSPNAGCVELRESIRQYLARNRGMQVDIEQIVVGAGSEYLYGLIVELLGRHRVYAIEAPSYKKIEQVYQAAEITYESLPLAATGIDSNALASTKAEVLHTTP